MSAVTIKIVDGPAADRLFDSMKYAYSSGDQVYVTFRIEVGDGHVGRKPTQLIKCFIKALSYEKSGRAGRLNFVAKITEGGNAFIKGYYNSDQREGTFEAVG